MSKLSIEEVRISGAGELKENPYALKEDGETAECLKCGEECGQRLVGDELYLYCPNCNYYDGQ